MLDLLSRRSGIEAMPTVDKKAVMEALYRARLLELSKGLTSWAY
jgi:hypothetical protein